MIATLAVDRFDARIPTLKPGHEYTCPNCRAKKFTLPDVVCTECQKQPRFAAAVDEFNDRQAARRQERGS